MKEILIARKFLKENNISKVASVGTWLSLKKLCFNSLFLGSIHTDANYSRKLFARTVRANMHSH